MEDGISNEVGEEGEDNGVSQEKEVNDCSLNDKIGDISKERKESTGWQESEEDNFSEEVGEEEESVTEVERTVENEDKSSSEEGELSDVSDENLPAITKKGRSASENLNEGERRSFAGVAISQQIDNDTEMAISLSSDEDCDDASPSTSKTKKLRKVCIRNSV